MSGGLVPDGNGSYRHPGDPGEPSTSNPRVSVTDEEAAILAALFHKMTVVEFGTGLGVSTRALASTAQRVHTVDIDPWVHGTIWPSLPANVSRHKGRAQLPNIVDGAFIDGDHSVEATRDDVDDAAHRAILLIVVHDFNADPVRSAAESVTDGWLSVPTRHGLGVKWLT